MFSHFEALGHRGGLRVPLCQVQDRRCDEVQDSKDSEDLSHLICLRQVVRQSTFHLRNDQSNPSKIKQIYQFKELKPTAQERLHGRFVNLSTVRN
jgi:hypothetical protein